MSFRIAGLDPREFSQLASMSDTELAKHRARREVASTKPGYPCRITLDDAEVGEEVILANYEHLPVDSPYRASHAIFFRTAAKEPFDKIGVVPPALLKRLISLRAFDSEGLMVSGEVLEGWLLPPYIEKQFHDERVAYLHAHFAKRGCFAARIDRA
jgi:uncharacterized protein DUF1203